MKFCYFYTLYYSMNHLKLQKPLAFFDLETTGIDAVNDRIVEIAIVKVMPNGTRQSFVSYVNPGMPIPISASEVHGIYDQDVADAPEFKAIASQVLDFLTDCDLAGYNSNKFDLPVLTEEFYRAGIDVDFKKRKLVDVQQIFFKKEARTLSAAYEFYCNKSLENAHSAEADVLATIEVLDAQLGKYDDLLPEIEALHQFTGGEEMVDFARRLVRDKNGNICFNFGKHKGKTVSSVFINEPQYLDWICSSDFSRDTKKIVTKIYNDMKLTQFKK